MQRLKEVFPGTVEAGSEDVAVTGGDSMAGLEAAAAQIGTKLPGFVSAGVQGGQQPAQEQKQAQQPRGGPLLNAEQTFLTRETLSGPYV